MRVVKVTSKGQVTIPVEMRRELGITEDSYVEVRSDGKVLEFRPVRDIVPLSDDDPIWGLVGIGKSGLTDISERHDHYLAELLPG